MTYTEDFVRSAMANYFILEARIREVAIAVETLRGGTRNASEDYTSFEFYEGSLIVKFEYYCCGGTEYDQFELPIEYLWLENFEEVEKTRLEAAKEAARLAEEAKRLADEALKAKEREKRDLADWERLKKRFGS